MKKQDLTRAQLRLAQAEARDAAQALMQRAQLSITYVSGHGPAPIDLDDAARRLTRLLTEVQTLRTLVQHE